jgi:TraG P-loop domain/Helicase HerA, central domain
MTMKLSGLLLRAGARAAPSAPPAGLLGPDAIEVGPTSITAGATVCRSFAVTGYPHEVGPGWLEPLASYPGNADIALHIDPIPAPVAAQRLRRQLGRLESTRRLDDDRGRLADLEVEAAAEDAHELARRLARGQGRLYQVGLYITVRGHTHDEVDAEAERLRALCSSLLLDVHPATFRSLQGWTTTLPLGLDQLGLRRTMDTAALAAAFPFASADLPTPSTGGVLLGRNAHTRGLVLWDRWAQPNYNSVILAKSGAGKSYLAKLELLRWLYHGVQALVIDPEHEYARLADAVGGTMLRLGASGVRLNPLDLPHDGQPDALARRALFAHTLIATLLGGPLDPDTTAALDRAVLAAYKTNGITGDPRTHPRPAPVLADLAAALERDGGQPAATLAARLAPYTSGSHRRLFDGPTTTRPEGHLVVFSLRELPDELKATGMLLALDAAWRTVSDPRQRRRRLVVVDEAWQLLRDQTAAGYLYRFAKSARKHWCALTVVTQDPADMLASPLGQAIVQNAATQLLLGQAPQAIQALTRAFHLSAGEQAHLLAAQPGDALLLAGPHRVALRSLASPTEHRLVTTSPAELATLDDQDAGGAAP